MINDYLNSGAFSILTFIWKLAPFWAPPLLAVIAWRLWVYYINFLFISKIKWTLLEVRIPKDVFKSPLAMEVIFANAFYQTGGTGNWYAKYWDGKVRMWFSLEIVSIGGKVYFFIRTPSQFKNIIEAQIYAQYPKAELNEVPDYTDLVPFRTKPDEWEITGTEFKLSQPDSYPIKTYVDYGLDKPAKEDEQHIDPLTAVLEYLCSVGPDEQVWIQVMIRATTKKVKDESQKEIKAIIDKYATVDEKGKKMGGNLNLPKNESETISAIARNAEKLAFDCGMRSLYIAKKGSFNAMNLVALLGSVRQYNSNTLNGFAPTNVTAFDYPWQDLRGTRLKALKGELFDAYRARSVFYMPHSHTFSGGKSITRTPFMLSTEELATIYHFPGKVSETPSFKRIESRKAEPPTNLPI